MVTEKDYVWPVIKKVVETVWDFVSQLLLGIGMAIAVCLTLVLLKWWSILVFAIVAIVIYICDEVKIAYITDKSYHEEKVTERLNYLMRLPNYWTNESLEKKHEWYKKATADFIEHMDEYEKRYGKDDKYQAVHTDWVNVDKILRGILEEEEK